MSQDQIQKLQMEIFEKQQQLFKMRKDSELKEVSNYEFETLEGKVKLIDLFLDKDTLFMIHNMGPGCRYCTLWADGLNGFLPHLETQYSVVLTSKSTPEDQRKMANARGWRYRMVSHGGGDYIKEQTASFDPSSANSGNFPGLVCYVKKDGKVFRKNSVPFGPGDEFCSLWNIISLTGHSEAEFTPQFSYWKRPAKMEDGGESLVD